MDELEFTPEQQQRISLARRGAHRTGLIIIAVCSAFTAALRLLGYLFPAHH
jgi:hypothetical protein